MSKKCQCGTWNPDEATFCRNCGTKLDSTSYNTTGTGGNKASTATGEKMSDMTKVIFTIIIWGVFIAIACGTGGLGVPLAFAAWYCTKKIWEDS